MNQKDWYNHLQTVKRRHYMELAEVKRLQQLEIDRIEEEMVKAEPTEDFTAMRMKSVDVEQIMVNASEYALSA